MAIFSLIVDSAFCPEEIETIASAYETALCDLGLVDRNDPLTDIVAKAIINVAAIGERNPEKIKERALRAVEGHKTAGVAAS
jgi:hypothetical protein